MRSDGVGASRDASAWLGLAAAPAFAVLALLTAARADGPAAMLCSTAHDAWSLGGMVPMYALMSVFHAGPWLRLVAARRG